MVSITKWLIYGLVGAFALSSLIDPARASGTVGAFSGIGGVLGNLGTGLKSLGQGAGSGAAGLLNPLWTLRDLIYGPQAGVQTPTDIQQATSTGLITTPQQNIQTQEAIQLDPNPRFTPITAGYGGVIGMSPNYNYKTAEQGAAQAADHALQGWSYSYQPGLNPIPVTQAQVHGVNVPLTTQAVQHYQSIGVDVSPANPQTVAATNGGNATGGGAQASASSGANTSSLGSQTASGGGFRAAN